MNDGQLPAPKILGWQALYAPNALARCVKDDPPMIGFGRRIKVGEIVKVGSVCYRDKYEIGVDDECAFYELEGYFEVQL